MRFEEYIKKAVKTCAILPTIEDDNNHMLVGMLTEIGELADIYKKNLAYKKDIDVVNAKEELGDLCWYVSNFCNFHDITPELNFKTHSILYKDYDNITRTLMMAEAIRPIRYGLNTNPKYNILFGAISDILTHIFDFCLFNSFDLEEILDTNIEKLEARYPEKFFTEERADKRNLKKERDILEKGS